MISIDLEHSRVTVEDTSGSATYALGTPEAFAILSKAWLRCGWDNKHVYSFTWLGRPMIQLPEDMLRMQEVIYQLKPDVIIETGVAHGGSLVFYASLCHAMGHGRVIGIDIEIRAHNRHAIEAHGMSPLIALVEGSSIDTETRERVAAQLRPADRVLVVLDANHTRQHVLRELELYAPLVSVGSYIVAADGIMAELENAPRTQPDWTWNNPKTAAAAFADTHDEFVLAPPAFVFNEGKVTQPVTYWCGGWLRRVR